MARVSIAMVVFLVCVTSSGARKPKPNLRSGGRPAINSNIIFILTDDMDSELGSPDVMRKTQKILREEGTDFVNAFVTTPMCCPSRSSILTGTYAHNHNIHTNNLNCSSLSWRRGPERKTFARYLQEADYMTGYFGKYLNEYDGSYVPVGYDRWEGLIHNSRFYNYSIRHNAYTVRHRASYEKDYFTDLLTNDTIAFIRHVKVTTPHKPFLAVVSHAAPHGPETAAPQYNKAFPGIKAPRFPNWNFYSPDKQWILRETPPMDERKIAFVDLLHRRRLQTLLSVDDSIERIFSALQAMEIENETYIFFSSDHGYHLGQFGLVKGKSMPYESDIRIPLYVRGPSIPKKVRMKEMVLSIDLAPTFLDIANVRIPKDMDGTSIMKLFKKNRNGRRGKRRTNVVWRDTFLIERSRGWRKKKGFPEKTTANKTQTKKARKAIVLEGLCSKPRYLSPCKPGQVWECVTVDNRPRLRKCRRNLTVTATMAAPTPPAPTVKMCVCIKPRPETERIEEQRDFFPDDAGVPMLFGGIHFLLKDLVDDLFPSGYLDHLTEDLTRRSTRSHHYKNRLKRRGKELSARKYYRELVRASKLQNRRAKSKALIMTPAAGPNEKTDGSEIVIGPPDTYEVPGEVEQRLGKLTEKIQGIRMRLEALRDRKKKLLMLSSRDRLIEYPCPCNVGNNTAPAPETSETMDGSDEAYFEQDEEEEEAEEDLFPAMRRRKKQPKFASKRTEGKKKKAKTNLRRSKCAKRGVNCFYQTNHHWKLPPLWTGGEFCFCPTAANNSYWCLRTINATHNFLYCEFVTHFVEYFDLNRDPYQLYNMVHELSPAVLHELRRQLNTMKGCKGESCTHYHGKEHAPPSTLLPTPNTAVTPSTSLSVVSDGRVRTTGNVRFSTTAGPSLVVLNGTALVQLPSESPGAGYSLEGSAEPSNCTMCTFESPTTESLVLERDWTLERTRPPKRRKERKSTKKPSSKRKPSMDFGVFTKSNEKDQTSGRKTGSEGVESPASALPLVDSEERSETFANSSDVTNFPILAISTSSPTQSSGKKKSNGNFREYLSVKPTGRQKSSKRRKNGERADNISPEKESPKSSKKPRTSRRKSSGNRNLLLNLNHGTPRENETSRQIPQNKMRKLDRKPSNQLKKNLTTEEYDSKLGNSSEDEEVTLREMLLQPSKRPTTRRPANRKAKKKLRRKTPKRTKSSKVDEGNSQESEQPFQNGGGFSYERDPSHSDP